MTNDNFANAIRLIGFGDNSTGNNVGFTPEGGEPSLSGISNSTWWKYTPPSNGTLTIDTNGSNFDTVLGVYSGTSLSNLVLVDIDDNGGVGSNSLISFSAVRGVTYFIAVDGFQSFTGNINLNIALTNPTSGNAVDLIAIGDANDNSLNTVGLSGNDVLDGKSGADTLQGGAGDDTYFIDNVNDRVTNESSGVDQVFSKSNHVLDAGVENLTLAGFSDINGTGNELDNEIIGNNGNNILTGGDGDDVLDGGDGDDVLDGGDGNNVLDGGDGNNVLDGGDGNNVLTSGSGGDILTSGSGNDFLNSGSGADTVISGSGDDILIGGSGDDILIGDSGRDTISGDSGDDVLDGGDGDDVLDGGDGNDLLNGGSGGDGNDLLDGGSGTDTVSKLANANFTLTNTALALSGLSTDTLASIERATLIGGAGNNIIDARNFTLGAVDLYGDGGSDQLIGGTSNDYLSGDEGDDTLAGREGNDIINGGNGTDRITGSADVNFTLTNTNLVGLGIDTFANIERATLTSGVGNNTIDARSFTLGSVILNGEDGDDTVIGGTGSDTLNGDEGDDTLAGREGNDIINGGNGTDRVTGSADVNFTLTNTNLVGLGIDTLTSIERATLTSGAGNNTIDARNFTLGSVILNGEDGDDTVIGSTGSDTLSGGDGDDTLAGREGNDIINGGNGIDRVTAIADVNFTLTNTTLTGVGTDTLTSIETATLTGGVGNNTISASAFTLGSVTLNGDLGNDTLRGGSKNDTLNGGDGNDGLNASGITNGVGSIDTLTGGAESDNFVLASSTTVFYNDGNNANAGLGDYALITDFSSTLDKIQLGSAASLYVLGSSPIAGVSGTAIYLDTNTNGAFNSTDELIAIVQGSSLNLLSSSFLYV